jgi:hypothetical protein
MFALRHVCIYHNAPWYERSTIEVEAPGFSPSKKLNNKREEGFLSEKDQKREIFLYTSKKLERVQEGF